MDVQQVIKSLKQIVEPEQIMTDPIDLYVYSFRKIFDKHSSAPDIVVRTLSAQETEEIVKLARRGFSVVKRGQPIHAQSRNEPLVLLDSIPAPRLEKPTEEKIEITKISREIHEKGYGNPKNLALAMKTLLLQKNITKCEECETCSGYCTVSSSFEGAETWSSKGRTLIIKGLQNGELSISKKIIDIVFTCTECGLCFAQCFENLEVNKAILATRNQIAKRGDAPEVFREAAKNMSKTGNPGGVSTDRRLSWIEKLHFQPASERAEVLYWVGCMVLERTPRTAEAFLKILNRANVDFTMLMEKESCCGYILLSTGLWNEAREAARQAFSNIEKTRAKILVTPCAGCYYTFTKLYPEILGITLPCEILHSSRFTESLIKNEELELKSLNLKVSYHDPCSLGRHSGIFDPPRNVLKAVPNLAFAEMPLNRQLARCCGGGGGLWSSNNRVSMESAYLRLKDLEPRKAEVLATACPLCQMNLRYAASRKSIPLKVCSVSEIVESALA